MVIPEDAGQGGAKIGALCQDSVSCRSWVAWRRLLRTGLPPVGATSECAETQAQWIELAKVAQMTRGQRRRRVRRTHSLVRLRSAMAGSVRGRSTANRGGPACGRGERAYRQHKRFRSLGQTDHRHHGRRPAPPRCGQLARNAGVDRLQGHGGSWCSGPAVFPLENRKCFNVPVVFFGGPFWDINIAFRDYLRTNPDAAREYAETKRSAVETGATTLPA